MSCLAAEGAAVEVWHGRQTKLSASGSFGALILALFILPHTHFTSYTHDCRRDDKAERTNKDGLEKR